ncbi:MAG: hypothetical protein AAF170_14925 [Bacteroidota bacterium]
MTRLLALLAVFVASASPWAQPVEPLANVSPVEPSSVNRQLESDTLRADDPRAAPRHPSPPIRASLAGMVWQRPDSTDAALRDLEAMHQAGVRAVRTGVVENEAVLAAADRLGLAIWQDLPVESLPASFLVARTDSIAPLLREVLERSRPYRSARHIGLARASDTSDPVSRPYFERLTALVRQHGAPGTQSYFITRFPDDDRAHETVDLVLLDARDADPVELIGRWRARRDTPVGLASYGTGVVPGREGGWRTQGSLASQARAFETTLDELTGVLQPPVVAFVHRWRDVADEAARRDQRSEVAGTRFGLFDETGEPRPAFDVVSGIFTGRQRVFAFNAGTTTAETRQASPLIFVGWILMLGLGLFYAGAPKLSALAPRYFGRRDLYREAVSRGYDLSTSETAGLALGLCLAAGVVGTSILRALGRTDALVAATSAWTPEAQLRMTDLLGRPLVLVSVLALVYGTWLLLNLIWLNVLAGRVRRLRPAQALSLAVWSRWAWLPLMILSLLLVGISPRLATTFAPVLLGLALLVETVAAYRMLYDLSLVIHLSPARALLVGFGVPVLIAAGGLIGLAIASQAEMTFLWHLATRS